jgi:hypothetical protein
VEARPLIAMAPVQGDPVLVEQLRFGVRQGDVDRLMGRAARCWDRYGLPDRSKNPGRRPDGKGHWTLVPTEKIINESLNTLLRPVLDPADRWLLDIPRVLVPDRSSAHVLMSRKGAALGMPWSAFGGLFFANALRTMFDFAETYPAPADRTWRARRQRRRLARRLPPGLCAAAIRHWLTGIDAPTEFARAVERLESVITVWMKWSESYTAQAIWAVSVFQQALMTLHEFGHIVELSRDRPTGAEPRATRCTLADELGADLWSRRYAHRLVDVLFTDPVQVVVPLIDLFSTLDVAELPDPVDPRRADLAERCALLTNSMVPTAAAHRTGVLRRFADVRSLYDRPAEFLLADFRRYDDFFGWIARGDNEFDDDRTRAMFDGMVERWT